MNKDIEKILLDLGFTTSERILEKTPTGKHFCHFLKARDKTGKSFYIELDCDYRNGMGYIRTIPEDPVLTPTNDPSVVPYSLKLGTFETNKNETNGVVFECDGSLCAIKKKDTLDPVETVYKFSGREQEISPKIDKSKNRIPTPFPLIKISELVTNPRSVEKAINISHDRMRNISFEYCTKEISNIKENVEKLQYEVERFVKLANRNSQLLPSTINELEKMQHQCERQGITKEKTLKAVKYNLEKRHDLVVDHISLCQKMKEKAIRIATLNDEIKSLNDYIEILFNKLDCVYK